MNPGNQEKTRLTDLPGIGDRMAERLAALGVRTVTDLLFLLPRAYQDRTNPLPIPQVTEGQFATVRGQVISISERRFRTRRTLEVLLTDGRGVLLLKWFRFNRWLKQNIERNYPPGSEVLASGRVSSFSGNLEMHHPDVSALSGSTGGGVVPVYPLAEGLSQRTLRKAVQAAVSVLDGIVKDGLPTSLCEEHGFPGLPESLRRLHEPLDQDSVEELNSGNSRWHRRLKFDELLGFQLGLLMRRRLLDTRTSQSVPAGSTLEKKLLSGLPFDLTRSQRNALEEIGRDMEKLTPMHRLLQGDVGSGKTLVAFIAMLRTCESGNQAVLMAPTEILAEQHHRTLSTWCKRLDLEIALLTGSADRKERTKVLSGAQSGQTRLFVGTHALIQEGVAFKNLNLAIVDEQHRFGVLQRLALGRKGLSPHFLVMTATPIPRSLSMVLYGDLDVTVIDEMPPGRIPVETLIYTEADRSRMHLRVSREVDRGGQVYIVYPLVEESEKLELLAATEMADYYREKIFPHLRTGLLTGRMSAEEKDAVMDKFRSGEYQILVSTTVIEVGVDVPNANLMIVEHAERFGLFQLHQLRGRVGRGTARSACILMEGSGSSDLGRKRLEVIAGTTSGFDIAEADLEFRGPGDFLGVRQAGMPDFRYANPMTDQDVMLTAKKVAYQILPEGGKIPPGMMDVVRRVWSGQVAADPSG